MRIHAHAAPIERRRGREIAGLLGLLGRIEHLIDGRVVGVGQRQPHLAVELGDRVADPASEPAALVAHQLEAGERMDALPGASQLFGAAHDIRKVQTLAEQTGDLARPDQIPEAAFAAAGWTMS